MITLLQVFEMQTIMMAKTQKTGSPSTFRFSPESRKAAL